MAKRQSSKSPDGALESYRAKRSAERTPEPFGAAAPTGRPSVGTAAKFVVQKHAARRTHYDLRLELDGVLKSWAVPKGPSPDPAEKRLAVATEDHPLQYSDFEGVIPEGNYGAGAMIVWDRGAWIPLEDPREGMVTGKLLFELRGHKLRGVWTLFRTKPPAIHRGKSKDEEKQWLLVKKPDFAATTDPDPYVESSILSGLTVEELGAKEAGIRRFRELALRLRAAGASEAQIDPRTIQPMLAQPAEQPFDREGWIFELKYDGYRLIAACENGEPYLRYRNGHEVTALFPELSQVLERLPVRRAVLDGEVVVLDAEGRPSFSRLQQRALLSRRADIDRAVFRHPATLFCFDLLELDGLDLRTLPLLERKQALRDLLPPVGPLRYCDHIDQQGKAFFEGIQKMGLEGMVAKRADSPYVSRRSSDWQKIRCDAEGLFVIVGLSAPRGARGGFGSLHVAVWDAEKEDLVYAGRVGTGFGESQLEELSRRLEPLRRDQPPCRGEVPRGDRHTWVEPELVCRVRFKEWTPQGMLRHPVFLGLVEDAAITECVRHEEGDGSEPPPVRLAVRPSVEEVELSNLDKVFWPEDGLTKGDLIDYYRRVADHMLPYLEDRPLVLTRYPDGIEGKSFFQKNAPTFAPEWIRTERIWSEGSQRDIEYFICNDAATLVYLANLATIPIHVWSSRLSDLEHPDWCVLDLDPKEAPFGDVVAVAREIHALCREIELPSFVKTSGSTGLHVLIPLGGVFTYEQSRTLGMLIARVIARRLPDIATVARSLEKREGKVYLDFVQNGHGRLIVAPYCVRPLPGAPVSAPLAWREVTPRLELAKFNIRSMPRRLSRQKRDPMRPVLSERPDLLAALGRLSELV